MVATVFVTSLVVLGGLVPLVMAMALCACFRKKQSYMLATSSQHEENLRLPLSQHASPVCGDHLLDEPSAPRTALKSSPSQAHYNVSSHA
jgi:hypothetical protein